MHTYVRVHTSWAMTEAEEALKKTLLSSLLKGQKLTPPHE